MTTMTRLVSKSKLMRLHALQVQSNIITTATTAINRLSKRKEEHTTRRHQIVG